MHKEQSNLDRDEVEQSESAESKRHKLLANDVDVVARTQQKHCVAWSPLPGYCPGIVFASSRVFIDDSDLLN